VFFEETDSVHLIQAPTVNIVDTYNGPDDRYHTKIGFVGHDSIVVWNPWQQKSISMVDMADNSYQSMLCVESAITQGHQVAAGQTHVLQQVIS
jgi:glucose-6-phosphate 1-epimerase